MYIHTMKAVVDPAAVEDMAGCFCLAMRKAARAVTRYYDRALRAHGLRATQLSILVAASQRDSIPSTRMAQVLGLDRTTLLRNVRPLVRRRLLEVSQDHHSHRTEVRATTAGRALLRRLYPDWKRAQGQTLKGLKGAGWTRGLEALGQVVRSGR